MGKRLSLVDIEPAADYLVGVSDVSGIIRVRRFLMESVAIQVLGLNQPTLDVQFSAITAIANAAKASADAAVATVNAGIKPDKTERRILITTNTAPAAMTAGATLDTLTLVAGDLIIRAYNGDAGDALNGGWTVQASGAALRSSDMATSADILRARFYIFGGTKAGETWSVQNTTTINVNVDAIIIKKVQSTSATTNEVQVARNGQASLNAALVIDRAATAAAQAEIDTAQGAYGSLNARLNADAAAAAAATATAQSEINNGRGSFASLDARYDFIEKMQRIVQRDLAAGLGWSPAMLWLEDPDLDGDFYDAFDMLSLAQDEAGTVPVTAAAQPVRLIKSLTGRNDMTILTTGTPGTFRETPDGRRYIDCDANGIAYRTAATKLFKFPMYIAAGLAQKTSYLQANHFGVVWADSDLFAFRGVTTGLGNFRSWLRYNNGTVANPATNTTTAMLNQLIVADAQAKEGYCDVLIDGVSGNSSAASPMVNANERTTAVYGINMLSASTASNARNHFYVGIIIRKVLPAAVRAKIVAYLKARTQRAELATDKNHLIVSDSTGDEQFEWTYRLGSEIIAADATATVLYHLYDERQYAYTPPIVIQEGTGGPVHRIRCAAVSGRTPQSFTGVHFGGAIQSIPRPATIWWNHGHNIRVQHPVDAAYVGRFIGPMDMVRAQWPGVPTVLIRQNPWRDGTEMNDIMTALTTVAALYGDLTIADIHAHYISNSKPAGWYLNNIHPNTTGFDQWMPIISAAWTAVNALPSTFAARPALAASTAANLLINGRFRDFGATLPAGWTKIGDGTVMLDASRRDGSDPYSVKIVQGASVVTKLQQQISAVAYRGQTVWLYARQHVIDKTNLSTGPFFPSVAPYGGDKSRGRVSISSDGTGTPVTVMDSGQTYYGGTNGMRGVCCSLDVPADANTLTIELFASNVTGVDEGVSYSLATLAVGTGPRNAA